MTLLVVNDVRLAVGQATVVLENPGYNVQMISGEVAEDGSAELLGFKWTFDERDANGETSPEHPSFELFVPAETARLFCSSHLDTLDKARPDGGAHRVTVAGLEVLGQLESARLNRRQRRARKS